MDAVTNFAPANVRIGNRDLTAIVGPVLPFGIHVPRAVATDSGVSMRDRRAGGSGFLQVDVWRGSGSSNATRDIAREKSQRRLHGRETAPSCPSGVAGCGRPDAIRFVGV